MGAREARPEPAMSDIEPQPQPRGYLQDRDGNRSSKRAAAWMALAVLMTVTLALAVCLVAGWATGRSVPESYVTLLGAGLFDLMLVIGAGLFGAAAEHINWAPK